MAKLITKAILKKLPALGATAELEPHEVKVPLKIFNPYGAGRWYITEYDPETGDCFGYVTGLGYDEMGYISFKELENMRFFGGRLKLERDQWWDSNTTLDKVKSGETY